MISFQINQKGNECVFQPCYSLSKEDLQITVPLAYLEERIYSLHADVAGKVMELDFIFTELGSANWEDFTIRKGLTCPSWEYKGHISPNSQAPTLCNTTDQMNLL
jgi:hypothetical protein